MSYQVIARKWRPQSFGDVVGQQHVTRTIENAIRTGRVAHAYIFSGARGVGKTTTARILAKALNCAKGPGAGPCNECAACIEITAGNSLDVLEIDAASNRGIDQVRELRDMVRYVPAGGQYKVVILDEAHMLTPEASNALLKTLEEPPDKVVFVMATTQPEDLEETIRSRSQHFHFRALSFSEIVDALREIAKKEQLDIEESALAVMARSADGSLRDAMSLIEQARAYCGDKITAAQVREFLGVVSAEILDELMLAIEERSAARALSLVHRLLGEGQNLQQFCREAVAHFRNVLVARVCGADSDLVAAPAEERPRLERGAAIFSEEDLTRFFQIMLAVEDDVRRKPDPRLHLEMGLLRMVDRSRLAPLEEIISELSGQGTAREARPGAGAANSAFGGSSVKSAAQSAVAALGRPAQVIAPTTGTGRREPSSFSTGASKAVGASTTARTATMLKTAIEEVPESNVPESSVPVLRPTILPKSPGSQAVPVSDAVQGPAPVKPQSAPVPPSPAPSSMPDIAASTAGAGSGLDPEQVAAIKSAVLSQQKFLGELVEHASRWELEAGEIRLYFPTESRALAELLQGRDSLEKLRTISSRVLGQQLRVCVKLEAASALGNTARGAQSVHELRARFERDPMVRAMLERFGGRISEVKRRDEE